MQTKTITNALRRFINSLRQNHSFKNAKISVRLGLLVSFLSLLIIVGGGLGILMLNETENELNDLFTERMRPIQSVSKIQRNTLQVRTLLLKSIIQTIEEDEDVSRTLVQLNSLIADIGNQWKTTNINENNADIKELLETYKTSRYIYGAEGVFPIVEAIRNKDAEEAAMIELVSTDTFDILESAIGDIVQYQLAAASADIEASISKNRIYETVTIVAIAGGLALAIVFSIIIIRGVTVPLNRAVKLANHVASGDLTYNIKVDTNDETGQLLRALSVMNVTLQNIVSDVHKEVGSINKDSIEIADSSNTLAESIAQGTVSLDLTTSHMENVVTTNRNAADSAAKAHDLAETARKVAEDGGQIIDKAVSAMNTISNSSTKISEITSTIDAIAFQTNLLALNASVEAARAGDQGLGFAVVANEVRNLSQKAALAAKEITTLIKNSVDQIKTGKEFVDQSGQALISIQNTIHDVADIVKKINTDSETQTAGIRIINDSISEVHKSSQENSATVVMSAVASDKMIERVNALMDLMKFFKIQKDGNKDNIHNDNDVVKNIPYKNVKRPLTLSTAPVRKTHNG